MIQVVQGEKAWLHIGTMEECNALEDGGDYEFVLHIWRDDYPDQLCKRARAVLDSPDAEQLHPQLTRVRHGVKHHGLKHSLVLNYRDGEQLDLDLLRALREAMKNETAGFDKVMVHCQCAVTRSPTLAIPLLCVSRRLEIWDAISRVYRVMWEQECRVPNICRGPLEDILRWRWEI